MKFLYLGLALILVFASHTATAQDMRFNRNLQILNEINSYKPHQSPKHERSKDVLNGRVIDDKNRVVGEVKDILLYKSGFIDMIDADFNRLRLGTDRLFVSYDDLRIQPVSNGYKMAYTDDQIEDIFPSLLANMATAAGGDNGPYSLRKIIGAKVKAEDGRTLGEVKDVLFDNLGGRAEMLYVTLNYRSLRGERLAIPFNAGQYISKGKSLQVEVVDSMADAIIAYAEEND